MSDSLKTAQAEAKGAALGSITFKGVEYAIERKPNTLLLSELARTGTGDPETMGVFAEFFDVTLGSNYPAFRKVIMRSDADETVLFGLLQEVLEKSLARPTK